MPLESRSPVVYDLLVIGGGLAAAGIASDAVARGLKTVLLSSGDFAAGSGSRSLQMIYGGLGNLSRAPLRSTVRSIRESHSLTRLAPGLVRWMPFLFPRYEGQEQGWRSLPGRWLYDRLNVTETDLKSRRLTSEQVLEYNPDLCSAGLSGGALFYDCVTDDVRLALSLILDAQTRGARIYNYVTIEELLEDSARITGATVRDTITGKSWRIRTRQIVHVTGRRAGAPGKTVAAERAVVVLRREELNLNHGIAVSRPGDRRIFLVVPWYEGVLVSIAANELPENRDEVDEILETLNWLFPRSRFTIRDVVSSYPGARRLRDHSARAEPVALHDGLDPIGKGWLRADQLGLTDYRREARQVVDRVVSHIQSIDRELVILPCWTNRIEIGNPPARDFNPFSGFELPRDVRSHLIQDYGSWAQQIASILEVYPEWKRRIIPGLPYILAEAYFAVTRQKARNLDDILSRRTRVALLDRQQGTGSLREICRVVAPAMHWSKAEIERQMEDYGRTVRARQHSPT